MRLGPWWIQPYTLRIMAGILPSLLWLWWRAPAHNMARRDVILWLWSIGLVTISLGRISYVLINWPYFSQNPHHMWELRVIGGIHGESALLGALLCTWGWAKVSNIPYITLLTWVSPAILAIAAGAWWGCLQTGCAWGKEISIIEAEGKFWIAQLPDLYHFVRFRYAVQKLNGMLALGMLGFALGINHYADIAVAGYCIGAAFFTLWRADPMPAIQTLRLDTLLNGLLALGLVLLRITQHNKSSRPTLR